LEVRPLVETKSLTLMPPAKVEVPEPEIIIALESARELAESPANDEVPAADDIDPPT
jgi:uncharacterized protein YjbK